MKVILEELKLGRNISIMFLKQTLSRHTEYILIDELKALVLPLYT